MVGIVATGAYVPRMRLQRAAVAAAHAWFNPGLAALARGERAMAGWDEDAITMAVESARDCLEGFDRARVDRLVLASTTHPFLDRLNAGVVKEALNLPDAIGAADASGSQRAGISALLTALQSVQGAGGDVLCVASEKRRPQPGSELELVTGDAAVSLLVGEDATVAEFLGSHTVSIDFVDHFREQGQPFDYGWEPRWIREEAYGKIAPAAIRAALRKTGLSAGEVDWFVMGAPLKGVNEAVAQACGIPREAVCDPLTGQLGDAGAAQPLLLLSHVLETAQAGEIVVVAGVGQGCDVLVFRATRPWGHRTGLGVSGWLARRKPESNYLKYLAFRGLLDLDRGPRAEFDQKTALTALYRNRKAALALVGGRCRETGVVQFPRSDISVGTNGRRTRTQDDYPFADRLARIVTHTADSLTFSPDPPVYYGAVDFEGGGRMTVEFADVEAGDVEVGAPMRMMFRVKAADERRGFIKYFWKAVPDYRGPVAAALAAE